MVCLIRKIILHLISHSLRYRILRCLLIHGVEEFTVPYIDMLVFSTLANGHPGVQVIQKLAGVCASHATINMRNTIFNILTSYINTRGSIVTLLTSGVNPVCYVNRKSLCAIIPLANALLLVSSTNSKAVLSQIEAESSSDIKSISGSQSWAEYRTLLHMLSVCGHRLQLHVMDYLYTHHASTYTGARNLH